MKPVACRTGLFTTPASRGRGTTSCTATKATWRARTPAAPRRSPAATTCPAAASLDGPVERLHGGTDARDRNACRRGTERQRARRGCWSGPPRRPWPEAQQSACHGFSRPARCARSTARDATPNLVEDVAQVGLDRLLANDQLGGDLAVRPAVHDEPCHLKLALRQRLDAGRVALARTRATVDVVAERSQLRFRVVAVPQRAAGVEVRRGALQVSDGTVALAGLGEHPAGQRTRRCGLDRCAGLLSGRGQMRVPAPPHGRRGRIQRHGGRRSIGPGGGQRDSAGWIRDLGRSLREGGEPCPRAGCTCWCRVPPKRAACDADGSGRRSHNGVQISTQPSG